MPFSQLRAFITSNLQELFLGTEYRDDRVDEDALSFLDDLTTTESLGLKKFKLHNSLPIADPTLAVAVTKLVVANEDSIWALELQSSHLEMSFLANHSLRNLKALCFGVKYLGNGEVQQPIQALVDGCPHVEHLRIWFEPHYFGTDLLAYSGLRAILAWQLLSFEAQKGTMLSEATLGEVAGAWPNLRKLGVNWKKKGGEIYYPLPRLADIVIGFPELEELDMTFHSGELERDLLIYQPLLSEPSQSQRLKRLKLGDSELPESSQYESMARFLALVCSPGLRIERTHQPERRGGSVPLAETEKLVTMGRDPDPDWDAVIQKVEELHGGSLTHARKGMQATAPQDAEVISALSIFERIAGTKALTVPEILGTILHYAAPPTLASAARVSRTWSTIALDKLWSDHNVKALDLLLILPLHLEEYLDPPHRGRFWNLPRNPTNDEWTRFCSYALRVRSLYISGLDRHGFDPRITEWKIETNSLFPRLRKLECHFLGAPATSLSRARSFITSNLRELSLCTSSTDDRVREDTLSFIEYLAATGGLQLQKFKLDCPPVIMNPELAVSVAKFAVASKDSIEALELVDSYLDVSLMADHSLRNLRALSFNFQRVGGGDVAQSIQVLVKGCPHVAFLRLWSTHTFSSMDVLDLSGLRLVLAWNLLSFEVQATTGFRFTKANLGEMGKAWPMLKKLDHSWNPERSSIRTYISISYLADVVAAFPELEELGVFFYYDSEEDTRLHTSSPWPEQRRLTRLQKLRLSNSLLPESPSDRDLVAQFLARLLPPGLRIDRSYRPDFTWDPVLSAEREKVIAAGRDVDPEWATLFRRIEELHGGVRIWVGSIPEDSDGVWF
ncbi:hypothetical protein FRC01_006313 [Tulasnella sp. 417]|nr:hypothetical protein FRC01_006313 [Tulasnella sp. 417]